MPNITNNPYDGINFATVLRLRTELHGHVNDFAKMEAMDDATPAFDAGSYFHYSGNPPPTGLAEYWDEYRWPIADWISQAQLDTLTDFTLHLPNVEQVFPDNIHYTTPFISGYIEYRPTPTQSHHYNTVRDGMALARSLGGLPILAHPYGSGVEDYGQHAMEVHNGHSYDHDEENATTRIAEMQANWDTLLVGNPNIFGVSVNDHFGPYHASYPGQRYDTGYQIVLATTKTYDDLETAITNGAMFAIADLGATKGSYPTITDIDVTGNTITITTTDTVTWISAGVQVATGTSLDTGTLPSTASYVRAQVTNGDGSTVFIQPFALDGGPAVADITSNMVLRLPLAEVTGTDASDVSPNDHTCTLEGMDFSTHSVAGPFAGVGALRSDNSSDDVIACGVLGLSDADQTQMCWVLNATEPSMFILASRNGSAGGLSMFTSANKLWAQIGTTAQSVRPAVTIWDGEWHHIGITYNQSAGEIRFYADGAHLGTDSALTGTWDDTVAFQLFDRVGEPGTTGFSMSDPRVYARVLTDAEFASIYAMRLPANDKAEISRDISRDMCGEIITNVAK